MTVQSSLARQPYTISGAGPYAIPFYFLADADIIAIRTPVGGGTPVTLTLTTHYTLSGAADEDGGALTLIGAAIVNGDTLTIINEPAILQLTQYPETGKFPAASHERALDKLTMIAKRVYDLASRSLRLNDGDTATSLELPVSSPGKLIGWDGSGNLVNTSPAGVGPGSIGTTELADLAVTSGKLVNDSVTTDKIADAFLKALSDLGTAADKLIYLTGVDTPAEMTFDAVARTLLTDRRFSGVATFDSRYDEQVYAKGNLTGNVTLNTSLGTYVTATVTGAANFQAGGGFTGMAASGRLSGFMLELTNGGAFAVTWPTAVKWPGGSAPALTASGVDLLVFTTRDGGTTWRGNLIQKGSA